MQMKLKRIIANFIVMCVAFATLLMENVVFATGEDSFEPLNLVLPYSQSSGDYADPNGTGLIFRYEGSSRWERALTTEKTSGGRKCRATVMCCRESSNLHTCDYYNGDCTDRLASKMIYKVDNSKLSADERELTIEFDYYDDPEFFSNSDFADYPSIEFKYLAYNGGSTPKINRVMVRTEGTGTWKTAKFTIHDAQFNHATAPNSSNEGFQDGYDICIGMGGNRGGFASTYLTITQPDTAVVLETEAQELNIPSTLIYDYKLPTRGVYNATTISWKSDDESVISSNGKVNRNIGFGNTVVKLTATINVGGNTYDKDFNVNVVNTPCYTIDSLVFETAAGTESYSAEPGGKLKYASVTKYTTSTSDNAIFYVAMYDANDTLVAVGPVKKVTATGNITFDIDIPQIEGIYARAFIWNGNNLDQLAYTYCTKVKEGANIYTIGDSTMQSYGTVEARQNDNDITGWVQVLPLAITDDSLTIYNKAVSGTSTLSYTNLGYIYPIYEDIKPGDYLVIQFAHNDEKPWLSQDAEKNYSPLEGEHNNHPNANPVPDWAVGRKTYEQWLRDYAAAARMKGAQVIFASPIYRRNFTNGVLTYNHYGYAEAMIDTAAELNAPLLDLHARSGEWLEKNDADGSLKYYVAFHGGTDNTHLTYDGAVEIANMAIGEMNRIGHPIAECFGTVPLR